MSDIFTEIKKITPRELENAGVVTRARRSGYICPACNNGTGDNGDGLTVKEFAWGYNYHCFKCGANFTAIDLIAEYCGFTQNEMSKVADKAKEMFNLSTDFFTFNGENKKVAAPMTTQATQNIKLKKDYTEFYQLVQNRLEKFLEETGGKFRGLSLEDLRAIGAGIATAADLKAVGENVPANVKCLILPFNESRFYMRSISDNPKIKRGNTDGGKEKIYNPYKIDFTKDFYVVEGEIDVISIHKVGFDAVATSGAGEYEKLITELKQRNVKTARIKIMFDNNDTGAGQQNAEKFVQALKSSGYMAENFILSPNEKYDANEFLQKDFEGFKRRLDEINNQAGRIFDGIDAQKENEELGTVSVRNYFQFNFRNEVENSMRFGERKTGFYNLDSKQIFLPGLYLLGGIPSAGKSTFAWQLLEQLSRNGEKCIYCSYELSQLEMFSKLVTRELYRRESKEYSKVVGKALTAAEIRRGNFLDHAEFTEVYGVFYGQSDFDLHLMNLQSENIDTLIKRLSKICERTEKNVTICIDYLQFIPHEKENAKLGVDDIVRKLKVFQRETNCTLIVISSLNRGSYVEELALDSFKESGNIEFTADVVWGLQLYFDKNKSESRKNTGLIEEKKKAIPRLIELKCLKNRNGANYTCHFKYLAHVDTFIACEESELKGTSGTSNLSW